jgi:hypothetical protein
MDNKPADYKVHYSSSLIEHEVELIVVWNKQEALATPCGLLNHC